MNRIAFYRKVGYCAAIALLLLPLSWLGQPPVVRRVNDQEERVEKGGKLAELRAANGLSQAQLGEIDPASETMRFASLGMSGVASSILWHQTIHYHKVKDWSRFMATCNQLIKLQPNFIKVWEFQAHNVAYNTSVEFDDYKYRYAWVKRGIEFLIDGARYNRDEPRLLGFTGHIFGQKFGQADEKKQFRRLFSADRDFHSEFRHLVNIDDAIGQSGRPDNWLVARLWYLRAQSAVDSGRPLRGESELIFHSHPPKQRINYAIFNEKDGYHGERARIVWERALREWAEEYGSRQVPTSFGHTLRLNERENVLAQVAQLKQELEKTAGCTFEQVVQEKRAKLTPESLAAIDTPVEKRTPQQWELFYRDNAKIVPTPKDVAAHAPSDKRREAERLAATVADLELLADRINRYRDIVNYDYWKTRCEVEMTELADQARQLIHDADQLFAEAKLTATSDGQPGAKEKYEEAWRAWAEIFRLYPNLIDDIMAEELVGQSGVRLADRGPIRKYQEVLNQLDEKLPDDFLLADILARYDEDYAKQRQAMLQRKPAPAAGEPEVTGAASAAAPETTSGAGVSATSDAGGAPSPTPAPARDETPPAAVEAQNPRSAVPRPPMPPPESEDQPQEASES